MDYAVLIWTIFVFVIGYYIICYVQIVIRVYYYTVNNYYSVYFVFSNTSLYRNLYLIM